MPAHWTYSTCGEEDELEQGDILLPTPSLDSIFQDVHPHFKHDKYLGFIVATQSCDLVRRKGSPKASYINLAAIRPLSQVMDKLFGHCATAVAPRRFQRSDEPEARRFLERLFNQNEQAMGLFFLHPDADAGIAEPAVAFLRVAVALRAEHYDALVSARSGRLTPEFRAKLGWLIGNLYVRPATPDWSDQQNGDVQFRELIARCLSEVVWIDDEIVEQALAAGTALANASPEQLEALRPPSRLDKALEEVGIELRKIDAALENESIKKLQNRLRNNGKFTKLFKATK